MTLPDKPTADQVRAFGVSEQCGMFEAKRQLMKAWRQQCLEDILYRDLTSPGRCRVAIRDLARILMEDT